MLSKLICPGCGEMTMTDAKVGHHYQKEMNIIGQVFTEGEALTGFTMVNSFVVICSKCKYSGIFIQRTASFLVEP